MAQRMSPTERQRRVGIELRRLRVAADMSAERAAALLGVDRSRLSNIEQGIRAISEDRIRTLACNCDCADEEYVDALVAMARTSKGRWWERYRGALPSGLLDIAELEANATRMRTAHSVHIPGVLQTSDHALAVFRVVLPPLPEHETAKRLALRLDRQRLLKTEDPPPYDGVIHEAALRMQFGGRAVARAQLEHLVTVSERDNITIRVIPFAAGAFPGAGQTVNYAEGAVPALDTVQVDSTHGPEFLHAEAQLSKYRAHLDWMERIALSPGETRDLIHSIARQL